MGCTLDDACECCGCMRATPILSDKGSTRTCGSEASQAADQVGAPVADGPSPALQHRRRPPLRGVFASICTACSGGITAPSHAKLRRPGAKATGTVEGVAHAGSSPTHGWWRDLVSFITLRTILPNARSFVRRSARLAELKASSARSLRQR